MNEINPQRVRVPGRAIRASRQSAFTLVELLVVIAIIGVLVSMLLPAVQAAREAARRAHCRNNLVQIVVAVNNYEMAHGVYPPGTIAATGPVASVPTGYHHSWISQILPYLEQRNAFNHLDRQVGAYHANNAPVRQLPIPTLSCPSNPFSGAGYTNYAGVHHDLEAPIDADNHGVFFLNSRVRYEDVSDGTSQTFFVGEKFAFRGDLGWLSGTRAALRNTGWQPNGILATNVNQWGIPAGPPGSDSAAAAGPDASAAGPADANAAAATSPGGVALLRVTGPPAGPLAVGGFESFHPGGLHFAMGDGSVRYISDTISPSVYQQMGHRNDGQLLNWQW